MACSTWKTLDLCVGVGSRKTCGLWSGHISNSVSVMLEEFRFMRNKAKKNTWNRQPQRGGRWNWSLKTSQMNLQGFQKRELAANAGN